MAEQPRRHGSGERPAMTDAAVRRHGSGERPAVTDTPVRRHSSGERPAVTDAPVRRHSSGERPAIDDESEFDDLVFDARVPWAVGDLIAGRYEIERPLGGGSMGDVFLGQDRLLKKPVALKVLRPDLAQSRDTVRRFLREVALAHSVTHQNVVRIYDTGEEKGLPFFTMEVLQGQVLDELLDRHHSDTTTTADRLPIAKIRSIAFDVLDAMEAAHRAGVVHRDLKPGNVMLTHRGAIVMDFGVAGIDDMRERGKVPPATTTLRSLVRTEVGTIFGSPAYMAPELWEGQSATVQSDLYAFGVMLYQMLTGRLPYSAKTPAAFVEKLSTGPPPPLRSLRRDVPWNLVRLVRRCMARDPQERPVSASAAANLISPLRGQKRRRFVTGAIAVSSIAVASLWMRATPSWRELGLPDSLAEAELSAAVRAFDIGERAAALRRLDRLAVRTPQSAALAFWRATVMHDLGDVRGRVARCGLTPTRGSPAWLKLAAAACEPRYRLALPAEQTLERGPHSIGP
ncbi:MAG: serine/threonine protein kinase, partial [Nannocystaceae bacterium]|nr:serine/threonine protein kinase [Nannocystaceae bacterium]